MSNLKIMENHFIIRETVGYDVISKVDLIDIPPVMEFLKVVHNYKRMVRICQKKNKE